MFSITWSTGQRIAYNAHQAYIMAKFVQLVYKCQAVVKEITNGTIERY